jgi:DNA invertase Pin-like site-specific DNA recombinase
MFVMKVTELSSYMSQLITMTWIGINDGCGGTEVLSNPRSLGPMVASKPVLSYSVGWCISVPEWTFRNTDTPNADPKLMKPTNLIAYRRVSTARQGASQLGLEGQEAAVTTYANAYGGVVLRTYTEIETGKRDDRPELANALSDCRRSKAALVIARLDRLSRNTKFLLTLLEGGVDVAFCDLPHIPPGALGKFLLTQMAAVAELEAGMISERTKAALAAYKARGGVLGAARAGAYRLPGGANPTASVRAGEVSRATAVAAYADLIPSIRSLRDEGRSLRQIAKTLNEQGHTLRGGGPWSAIQVSRILRRYC